MKAKLKKKKKKNAELMKHNKLYIALGSNEGNRLSNLQKAWQFLNNFFEIKKTSNIYESKPILYLQQQNFYNMAVLCGSSSSHPFTDFSIIKKIERSISPNKMIAKGPRHLDLDLIFWNKIVYFHHELTIPHHGFATRDFVLSPLREIMDDDYLKFFHLKNDLEKNIVASFNFSP